jgi:hypothetical protein
MKEELPVRPFPSQSETLQEFASPQAHEPIDVYFQHLPNHAKAWVVVRLKKAMGDWTMAAKEPRSYAVVLFFYRSYQVPSPSLMVVALSVGLGFAGIAGLIFMAFLGRSGQPGLFMLVVATAGVVTTGLLVPAYLIASKFSRYIHDRLLELEEKYIGLDSKESVTKSSTVAPEAGVPMP